MTFFRFLASFGYIGYLPASGTWASLVTALLFYWLSPDVPWYWQLPAIALFTLMGIALCNLLVAGQADKDPSCIVIDEVAGMWLALVFVPVEIMSVSIIFLLFRLFDIFKPWLVSWADTRVGGGLGIMLDDIIAGLLCVPVALLYRFVI